VAVASAGPYASLHCAPERLLRQHPTTQFLQAGCPSCRPSNSVKALKAKLPAYRKTLNVGVTFISRILQAKKTVKLQGANIDYIATLTDNFDVDKFSLTHH